MPDKPKLMAVKLLPVQGPPTQCVELFIYDNDGPEGFCDRKRFARSAQAIQYVVDHHTVKGKIDPDLNFTVTNYWD